METAKLTQRSQDAITAALRTATAEEHAEIEATDRRAAPPDAARRRRGARVPPGSRGGTALQHTPVPGGDGARSFTRVSLRIRQASRDLAAALDDDFTSTELLLIAIAEVPSPAAEIRRVIQVLSRRTKNNPLLVGEAGVGKSAISSRDWRSAS